MSLIWTVLVAAGSGTRFGGAKQYADILGQRVLERSLSTATKVSDGVVVVVLAADVKAQTARLDTGGNVCVVAGGSSRAASVRAGLGAVPAEADIICVHDAARPLATSAVFQRVLDAVAAGAVGAVPTVALTDTIRTVQGQVLDRSNLLAVQTPQAFRADLLRAAHKGSSEATDDATLVEALGYKVVTVVGERRNIKITHRDDVTAAESWLQQEPPHGI